MPKIPDKAYMDFSGGIRRDKSPFLLKDNEIQLGRNFDIDEQGRIVKRRGSYQYGDTASGSINNGAIFIKQTVADPKIDMVMNNFSATGTPWRLHNGNLDAAITAAVTTSVDISGNTFESATDDFECEGDLITYTNRVSSTYTLTASTVTSNHIINSACHQWDPFSNAASGSKDFRMGSYYCVLNNLLFINSAYGANSNSLVYLTNPGDGTLTDVTEPRILFATTFRDRIYGAGDSSDATNGRPVRVYFSNLADGTSWPTTLTDNSFDIEDQTGEYISGLKVLGSNLMIFKLNSFYSFSGSLPVKQVSSRVGAYNQYVVQELNGLIYTFCPNGIYVTNGSSTERISDPVKEYIKSFNPTLDAARTRVVTNTFAGIFGDKYFLYIGNVTLNDASTLSDVVLVYDTVKKNWAVYDGYTNATCFISSANFIGSNQQFQLRPVLWYGNSSGQVFRCFESRLRKGTTALGDDVYSDNFSNTGSPITLNFKTKPYDLGYPNYRKQFGYLKVFSERPGIHLSYQIDDRDPKPLGLVDKPITRFQFPADARGHRCTIIGDESSTTPSVIYNGHIFEDTVTIDKNAK